jgi:hypothetical protein
MGEKEFLAKLGFQANPFQFTNADEEDHLQSYFVPPPYFDSVWGDPNRPVSQVIFAPRGGGKSAQRKMLEYRAHRENIFALTYDRFEHLVPSSLNNLTVEYHLKNLIRLGLLGFLLEIHERTLAAASFQRIEREQIDLLCRTYLGRISKTEAMESMKSLRTLSSKAKAFLRDWSGPAGSLVSMILKAKGLGSVNLKGGASEDEFHAPDELPTKLHLEVVCDLLRSIGYRSVLILVDKVDEAQMTGNNAEHSFSLIKPLLRDLELLQISGIGFKFFLWDRLESYYREYARPDRVQQFVLSWTRTEITEMLSRRLSAFSGARVKTLSDLTNAKLASPLQYLVVLFAFGSPRDMIRICQEMLSEQLRTDPSSERLEANAIVKGILKFSKQKAHELAGADTLRELMKIGRVDFTANYIANKIFKINANSARTKISHWVEKGLVERIGEQRTGSRPVHHYAISDIRIAHAILGEMEFIEFMSSKILYCVNCSKLLLRDCDLQKRHTCHHCGAEQLGPEEPSA